MYDCGFPSKNENEQNLLQQNLENCLRIFTFETAVGTDDISEWHKLKVCVAKKCPFFLLRYGLYCLQVYTR